MKSDIIITNNPLRLSTKFFVFELEDIKITIDMIALFKADKYSESAYVNVSPFFKSKHCSLHNFTDWYKGDKLKEFINITTAEFFKTRQSLELKVIEKVHKKETWFNKDWLDTPTPLIISKAGRYGGTYLHKDLFLKFITSLDVRLEVELYKTITELISTATQIKINRQNTKTLFHPLTDTIKNIWIPKQSPNGQKWAYKTILDLANLKALNMTSRAYKEEHGITNEIIKEAKVISIRDFMTKEELKKIEKAEEHINNIIVYAGVTTYDELVKHLERF